MVRVLHYVGRMNRGGMESFIMSLYRKMDRETIQFDFAVHGENAGEFEEEILTMGGHFYYFPHMRKNPLKYRKAWRNFWKKNKNRYTAFHMHTNSLANLIALEEAYRAEIPVRILHSHSSMANKGRLQWLNDFLHKRHQTRIPRLATHLFTCSDKAAKWLFGGMKAGGLSVRQINNGVDTQRFCYDEEKRWKIRNSYGFTDANKVIGHVGSFIPVKNHQFLVDIIEKAYRQDSSVRGLLIGAGKLLEEMKELVRQKGLDQVIFFPGSCDHIEEFLSAMDIFVMPSLYEGLPVSLVEVQANGLPALVSDSITKDVKLRDNLQYLALSESAEIWSKKALLMIKFGERDTDITPVIEHGFDMKDTAAIYERIVIKGEQVPS